MASRCVVSGKGVRQSYNYAFTENARFNAKFHESLDWELERARQFGFETGYQAATSDAKALVVELELMIKRAKALHETNSVGNQGYGLALDEALTKATAWLSKEGE